jgi:aryl-alcohol dehydrogenase-like predicted oxidoreductase
MWAHQFADALHVSEREGYERFVTMQNLYNLAYREEEREMVPLCEREDVGMIPWSPVGAGYLARPFERDDATTRGEHETALNRPYREGGGEEINRRVQELAEEKGVKMAQIALRWVAGKDVVDAPIVGTSSVEHLEDAVEALDIDLSTSDVEWLEEPYQPVRISGHE